jgi:hypothetical protein
MARRLNSAGSALSYRFAKDARSSLISPFSTRLPRRESTSGYRITIARSLDEVEAMRAVWRSLEIRFYAHDIDHYLAEVSSRPSVVRPHVVMLERDNRTEAIAMGRIEHTVLDCKFGYKTVYRPKLRLLLMLPGGLVGDDSDGASRALVGELIAFLARGEADAVLLYGLRADSVLQTAAVRMPPFFCRERFVRRGWNWIFSLPDSKEAFFASLSHNARGQIRGLANRLAAKYGERLSLEVFRSPDDIDRLFTDLVPLAAKTYQRSLGVAFLDTEEQRHTTVLAMERGWFRAYVLYLDGEPVAFVNGIAYGGTFFLTKTGYDPALRHDSLGRFVLNRMLQDLCEDDDVHTFDFGSGDAEYKRRFATAGFEEANVLIFAPTFRAVRINSVRTAIMAADEGARRTLDRTGALAPVKKWWRQRLAPGG